MEKKFFKNLFFTVCYVGVLLFLYVMMLIFLWAEIKDEYIRNGAIFLISIAILGPIVLYFVLGFFWVFQTVVISETGIRLMILKKTKKEYKWESIEEIRESNDMRNPTYAIVNVDEEVMHLDRRKKIKRAIEEYYQKPILK